MLFSECVKVNPRSHLVTGAGQVDLQLLEGVESVGICGATSTPKWLMEEVAQLLRRHLENPVFPLSK